VLAGAFAALSALDSQRVRPVLLERLLLVALGAWAVISLTLLPEVDRAAIPARLSLPLVALAAVGLALYAFAVVRYVALYRERRSQLVLGFAVAFLLLAEAMVALALGRSWQASWWEWHVLMLAAFALIAVMAHREGPQERFGRLYGEKAPERVTVLFADLQGFTSWAEEHDAADVSAMLDTLFGAAIPAIEEQGGTVDRLIGDAVFATFEGGRCEQRAARAALELQRATGAVLVEQPDWPRFRAGLHTGEASLGVLGTGTGRTFSTIGDTVNLGSRIEALAPPGGVALSGETAAALEGALTVPLGSVKVKGRTEAVEVFLLRELPS
jgi:adenylate cyclase